MAEKKRVAECKGSCSKTDWRTETGTPSWASQVSNATRPSSQNSRMAGHPDSTVWLQSSDALRFAVLLQKSPPCRAHWLVMGDWGWSKWRAAPPKQQGKRDSGWLPRAA
ncbi:uncharacterized protein CIMG_13291 [Coccidioides immitis RS]|uniref:Uncharacterized protein n=1 Tax=Coccidioides immitis (strain RS) TaxID=246410 RepID=J3K4B0_COCIM|nr:uncharacterized protein CIMG_13291 [Coccidioides immitis RS]EAS29123.3 hypothetical protein CIMG_13291 [Coccidioides immitis RS]